MTVSPYRLQMAGLRRFRRDMTFRTIRRFVLAIFLAALCCAAGLILLFRNPSVQRYGLDRISHALGCKLNAGKIGLRMGIIPGIRIQDIQVRTEQGKVLLCASDITIFLNILDLLPSATGAFLSGSVAAGDIKFQLAASGKIKDYVLPQADIQGKYDLNQRILQIASLKIITPDTSLSATGQIRFGPAASPYLDLSVSSPVMPIDTFKSLLPALMLPGWIEQDLLPAIKQGNIRVDAFTLRGSLDQIETLNQPEHASVLGLNMTLQNVVMQQPGAAAELRPELRNVSCALSINGGVFSLDGLSGRIWQSALQTASVVIPDIYATTARCLVNAEANLDLSDVNHLKNIPWLPDTVHQAIGQVQSIDGIAAIRVSVEYEAGRPFPKIITSAAMLQSVKVTHPLLRLPLTLEKAAIDSAADQPIQFSGRGLWGKSEFELQGAADCTRDLMSAKLTTRADVGELIELALPQAGIGKWIYGPLVAEGILDERGLTLDPARIEIGRGYLRLKGRQDYRSNAGMYWIGHLHIIREPAQHLLQLVKPGGNLLDGSVMLEGLLTLTAPDGTGRFSGLSGHARLIVEKGWIRQTDPILEALSLISLERIFKQGATAVQDGRLSFDLIDGEFEIEKGKILVQNLIFQSPAINASAAGTIDLNRDQIQLKIGLQPLGTVDSLVSGIPLIGNILTGKEKSVIAYSLEITGSLSDPQVRSVPFKNIGKSALGYVERMVFTPERILKSLLSIKKPRQQSLSPDFHAEFDQMTLPGR